MDISLSPASFFVVIKLIQHSQISHHSHSLRYQWLSKWSQSKHWFLINCLLLNSNIFHLNYFTRERNQLQHQNSLNMQTLKSPQNESHKNHINDKNWQSKHGEWPTLFHWSMTLLDVNSKKLSSWDKRAVTTDELYSGSDQYKTSEIGCHMI